MKNKNVQLYSNDCGLNAIKNLLDVIHVSYKNIDLIFDKNGTSIYEMVNTLKKYFYEVDAISFNINQIANVKDFKPFIILINHDNPHYVVVYKKSKKWLYVLDSLFKYSYKISYENANKLFLDKAIIVNKSKQYKKNKYILKERFIIPVLSVVESIFLLSSTVLLQQIIDNGFKDAILYGIVHLSILLITTIKTKLFLTFFKRIDKEITYKITKGIFNLKNEYVSKYSMDEIYYRTFDSYAYKNMVLSFYFTIINDVCLALLSVVLMFYYSYILAILVMILLGIIFAISYFIFKKNKTLLENKRKSEYSFINVYKDAIKNSDNKSKINDSLVSLTNLFSDDYKLEKLNITKSLILLYFQTFIITLMCVLYFTSLYEYISVGSLIALINLVSLVLQPTLNICCEISSFSNYSLIKQRLKDINDNIY